MLSAQELRRALASRRAITWLGFTLILFASSALRLRGLDSTYITLWDESVHVNVVSNLVDDCCTPRLHLRSDGSDAHDWMDSYIWLHKPPAPFLLNAAIAAPWSNRLFGIRLGAFIVAQAIVFLVFWIGTRYFDRLTALAAAALVGFNHYTFELVQGVQFSGIPDLTLACALLGALYALLAIVEHGHPRHFVVFGFSVGLAFLCKDGLALIPYLPFGIVMLVKGWRRHVSNLALAVATTLVVIAPPSIYLATRFPTEAVLEQQERIDHLLRDIDGWGRPVDFYWTVYFPKVTSPMVSGAAYVAVAAGLLMWRRHLKLGMLALWILSYLVVLSAGVSKVDNFIYPTLPAVCLLVPAMAIRLWNDQRFKVVLATTATAACTAAVLQWDLLHSTMWVVKRPLPSVRPALVLFHISVFLVALILLRFVRIPAPRSLSAAAAIVALGLVVVPGARASWAGGFARGRDYGRQIQLREAALGLRPFVGEGDVVLVHWPGLRKSHLYVKYWSGRDSFEISDAKPIRSRLGEMINARRVYLLSDRRVADDTIALSGRGYLRRLK